MPLHELMQTAHVAHEFVAGTQVEMIGVAQHQRGVDVFEMLRREGFNGSLCANRRKDWRYEVAVRSSEDTRAGAIVFG